MTRVPTRERRREPTLAGQSPPVRGSDDDLEGRRAVAFTHLTVGERVANALAIGVLENSRDACAEEVVASVPHSIDQHVVAGDETTGRVGPVESVVEEFRERWVPLLRCRVVFVLEIGRFGNPVPVGSWTDRPVVAPSSRWLRRLSPGFMARCRYQHTYITNALK